MEYMMLTIVHITGAVVDNMILKEKICHKKIHQNMTRTSCPHFCDTLTLQAYRMYDAFLQMR